MSELLLRIYDLEKVGQEVPAEPFLRGKKAKRYLSHAEARPTKTSASVAIEDSGLCT